MFKPGTMMVSRAGERIVRRHCSCCGDELNAHQARSSGICERTRCREWKIAQVGAELLQRRRRETLELLFAEAAPSVEAASAALGAAPDGVVRAVVRWQGRAAVPLPAERRAEFGDHLRWIVEEGFAVEPARGDGAARAALEADEAPVLGAACALCRGKCCERGGTTALLEEADIHRWRRREPGVTPDQVIAGYMAALPSHSVENACVYLGAAGCALPRSLRSDWCNAFQCKEREAMQGALAESADGRVVMIADDEAANAPAAVAGWSASTGLVAVPLRRAARNGQGDAAAGDAGDAPGGDAPGGDARGGDAPGGDAPGGDAPGGDVPGGEAGGADPGRGGPA